MKNVLLAMQVPFPELTFLWLCALDLELPGSFLGGSTPRLENLRLDGKLAKLLLSATHLVHLHLFNVPPDAMVTCLSTLSSLES